MGYGRSEAGKVTAAYNRALKQEQEKLNKMVDISGGGGIIKQNGSAFEMPNYDIEITEKSIEKVPYVEVIGFSSEKNVKFQYDDINKSRVNFSLVDKEEFYNAYTNAIEKIWRAGENFGFRYIKKV